MEAHNVKEELEEEDMVDSFLEPETMLKVDEEWNPETAIRLRPTTTLIR